MKEGSLEYAAEERRQKHRLYWRKLWFFLFIASTIIAALFAYAWLETDRLLRDVVHGMEEQGVLIR